MKLLNIRQKEVNVDIRPSSFPIKVESKSKLQKLTGEKLIEKYPRTTILEEFTIPGSIMRLDFFLPNLGIVVEVSPKESHEYNSFFHGPRESLKYAKQKERDRLKSQWCEWNNFQLIEIITEKDLLNL